MLLQEGLQCAVLVAKASRCESALVSGVQASATSVLPLLTYSQPPTRPFESRLRKHTGLWRRSQAGMRATRGWKGVSGQWTLALCL